MNVRCPAARTAAAREKEECEAGSDRPVGSFLAIMAVYLAGVGGLGVMLRRSHVCPSAISEADLALLTSRPASRAGSWPRTR
jgi:hypothetical protein